MQAGTRSFDGFSPGIGRIGRQPVAPRTQGGEFQRYSAAVEFTKTDWCLVINLNCDVGSEPQFAVVSEGPILDFQFQIEWPTLELAPIQGADERELGMMLG